MRKARPIHKTLNLYEYVRNSSNPAGVRGASGRDGRWIKREMCRSFAPNGAPGLKALSIAFPETQGNDMPPLGGWSPNILRLKNPQAKTGLVWGPGDGHAAPAYRGYDVFRQRLYARDRQAGGDISVP